MQADKFLKSTRIQIQFSVAGAKLLDVAGMDFEKAERPEVDIKNFKSALFVIPLGNGMPGGEARVSLLSDFFISSTQFYVFNESLPKPWIISDAANLSLPDLVKELVVTVKDGGPLDSDGKADGRITIVGGPRDFFWGYDLPPLRGGTVVARIPGLILQIKVRVDDAVSAGQVVAVLEAMKMKNDISSNISGTVTAIRSGEGSQVTTGDVIMVIDQFGKRSRISLCANFPQGRCLQKSKQESDEKKFYNSPDKKIMSGFFKSTLHHYFLSAFVSHYLLP